MRGRLREHDVRIAAQRPGFVTIGRIDLQRCAVASGRDACDGFEPSRARCRIPAVQSGERQILTVVLEDDRGIAEDGTSRSCSVADASEVTQRRQPALTDDATRRLADDAEDAADLAGFVAHRVI